MEVMTPPVGRHMSETIRQINAFQHVRATKGAEACPAGWKPGKKTLKPGPALSWQCLERMESIGRSLNFKGDVL